MVRLLLPIAPVAGRMSEAMSVYQTQRNSESAECPDPGRALVVLDFLAREVRGSL